MGRGDIIAFRGLCDRPDCLCDPGMKNMLSPVNRFGRAMKNYGFFSFASNRNVQAPVNICIIRDSLHVVCFGIGMPDWSRHINAIDKAVNRARRIHMLRLIALFL